MRIHGLKVLGLALLSAFGMMAFAGGAQAQELPGASSAGTFLINLGSALLATVTGKQLGTGFLLVAARDLKIECSSFDIEEGKINTSTDAQGKVVFLGCISKNHAGVTLADCQLKELETIRASALILPILHGGLTYVLFEPIPPATIFATPSYKAGTPCTLPLNNPVTGAVTALVKTLDAVVQPLLFSEAIQLLTGDKLAFGGFPAYINAEADVELTAPHAGQKLGIH
jgi:hypothetical protein